MTDLCESWHRNICEDVTVLFHLLCHTRPFIAHDEGHWTDMHGSEGRSGAGRGGGWKAVRTFE